MADNEAMIDQLRSASGVTPAQVAAAIKNAINNPRMGEAVLNSIREMGVGSAQLRRSFERAHELLKTLSEEHPTLHSLADRWDALCRRFVKHLNGSMMSTTKMQVFLTEYIEVLLPALKRDDPKLDEAGNIAGKQTLCNEFLTKITEHQNMAKCDQDNFDNLVSDVKDCGQETSRKLQHLDGRNVNPEKMQELKAQLAQLQKQLYGVQKPKPNDAWLYAAAGFGLAGVGVLVLRSLIGPYAFAVFVTAELIAAGCLVTAYASKRHPDPHIIQKLEAEIAATKKEINAMDGHLAVEAQIESVRMQLLFFSKTWSLIYHDLERLRGHFDSAATTTTKSQKVFEDMISLTENVYPLLTRALEDYATCNSPLDT